LVASSVCGDRRALADVAVEAAGSLEPRLKSRRRHDVAFLERRSPRGRSAVVDHAQEIAIGIHVGARTSAIGAAALRDLRARSGPAIARTAIDDHLDAVVLREHGKIEVVAGAEPAPNDERCTTHTWNEKVVSNASFVGARRRRRRRTKVAVPEESAEFHRLDSIELTRSHIVYR